MLTLATGDEQRDHGRIRRRDLLRIGTLGLGGLSLADLLAAKVKAGAAEGPAVRDRSVVLLFLAGGPSHIETFDPRMDRPEGVRSTTGEIPTSIPGVTFGGTFPKLAKLADRMAVVRSFHHTINNHPKAIEHVITAGNPIGAGMGAIYSRIRGPSDAETAIPTHGLVSTEEIDPQYVKERTRIANACSPGPLGSPYAPFDPAAPGGPLALMKPEIPFDRLRNRRALLGSVDQLKSQLHAHQSMNAMGTYQEKAFELILNQAGDALDLAKEDPKVFDRYDTSSYQVGHKRFRSCTLGQQMLMARRLCEAGCGFVTVQSCGWDMHADRNNPGIEDGMRMLGPTVDHAVAAFLEDLEARGLSEKILLVITGDFGRTPKVNKNGGRDHWAPLSTLAFAGGGIPTGQVIGRSSRNVDIPGDEPVSPSDLMATLMHLLFDIAALRLQVDIPSEIASLLDRGKPIRGLVG